MVTGDTSYLQRLHDLRHLLNGEWIPDILVALRSGPLHYKELLATIDEASGFDPWSGGRRSLQSRVLSGTLLRLTASGLVRRFEEPAVFPRSVLYEITPAAVQVLDRALPMTEWADEHADLIEHARRARAKEREDKAVNPQLAPADEPDAHP
ncbi:transcriptional regulator [Amycolatopsis sp.]|uniref:winged helix-turn-helix transcriptional regulator n=1 Tax=Amycolatopsis sp. TaxID=37632 RepID=UPI002D7E8393|nr:transcriptional regulator [Amycolatopsis sp.]